MVTITSTSGIFLLFCVINVLNYVDRGIIPGAPTQFQYFIMDTLQTSMTEQGFYLGLLASSFITSYAVFIVLFGYLSITMRPFRLIGVGLLVWCFALVLCGVAQPTKSFGLLLFGRILSGIGESSFQCISPAFIDDYAPASTRTLWMGIFFTGTSVGTAIGYGYGAYFAHSSLGWSFAFYLEALVMLPLALLCLCSIPLRYDIPGHVGTLLSPGRAHLPTEVDHLLVKNGNNTASTTSSTVMDSDGESISIINETIQVLCNPIFLLTVLGSSAFTFTISGLGVFGPLFLLGLGLFDTETEASMMFGSLVVLSAIIGTPIGGYFLDRFAANASSPRRQYYALILMTVLMAIGVVFCLLAWSFLPSRPLFLFFITISLIFLFATPSCTAVAVLLCVAPSRRNFAVGISTLLVHLLGDVPSPIFLGMLKDYFAPHCGSVEIDGEILLNPDCRRDQDGLRLTFLFPMLWLLWTIAAWTSAIILARCRLPRES
ncbi:unnamed protein product [Aphanomyces euteiches]|uniref:Major facilitator superfamily (MFS) profile domain-containing protein n=1 Tax=Aphanomyces euteiches TaxID=100861 RepID=A0A6G0XBZ1_9STRA|nr:hypothetical protein Ae201684_006333 [Aphanomyces euteiches]KAH9091091.1 hypothetical protein Ae201684P_006492 [Aphanomyces euteiches]KAH9138756.1 hypothetical protein AeRB84_016952 [Aphanomyces euteiches]